MTSLSGNNLTQIHEKLNNDLVYFAPRALKIVTKQGELVPLEFNRAQLYLQQCAEQQLAETGMVRLVIVKGRREGCSTWVAARFYHKVRKPNKFVFILSHYSPTTKKLFKIVKRFQENCPDGLRPTTTIDNNAEYTFTNNSEYVTATAGSGQTGRGDTVHLFHGSEVAFWENTDEIKSGALKAVADVEGTEVILESTANGVGNYFHQIAIDALERKGRFRLVFIPWYWETTYREKPPLNFKCDEEEARLKQIYGLDDSQMYWYRLQGIELGERLRKQEFPFTVHEAFQSSGNSFIDPSSVAASRGGKVSDHSVSHAPRILGVDPARQGDRTVLTYRQGRKIHDIIIYDTMDQMQLVGIIINLIKTHDLDKVFIDVGMGHGTIDRLRELHYGDVVMGVNFGSKSSSPLYLNKRAEMAFNFKDWLEEGNCQIPDSEDVATDILCIPDFKFTSSGLKQLVPKDEIKKIYGKSPDIFDSIILTFAYNVNPRVVSYVDPRIVGQHCATINKKPSSPFYSLQRRRDK